MKTKLFLLLIALYINSINSSSTNSLFQLFLTDSSTPSNNDSNSVGSDLKNQNLKTLQFNLLKLRNQNCIYNIDSFNNRLSLLNDTNNYNQLFGLLNNFYTNPNTSRKTNDTSLLVNYLNTTCFDFDTLKNLTITYTNDNALVDLIFLQSINKACDLCTNDKTDVKVTRFEVWMYGLIFVTIINMSSLVGAVVIPCTNKDYYKRILMFLVALAVGSLAGSGLLHLIPQAYDITEDPHYSIDHKYLWKSVVIMAGVYLFYLVERIMKIFISIKRKKLQNKLLRQKSSNVLTGLEQLGYVKANDPAVDLSVEMRTRIIEPVNEIEDDPQSNGHHGHSHFGSFKNHEQRGQIAFIAPVAWMIVFGDGLHNFIDGLSIGAAFSESILKGVSISIAVICEEFPHELGDFAILINSGMTYKQALLFNGLSACCCYIGLVLGILIGENLETNQWIYAIAGGMFLYISLCDMIPELTEIGDELEKSHFKALEQRAKLHSLTNGDGNNTSPKNVTQTQRALFKFKILIIQNIGILVGFSVMLIMAIYAKNIEL